MATAMSRRRPRALRPPRQLAQVIAWARCPPSAGRRPGRAGARSRHCATRVRVLARITPAVMYGPASFSNHGHGQERGNLQRPSTTTRGPLRRSRAWGRPVVEPSSKASCTRVGFHPSPARRSVAAIEDVCSHRGKISAEHAAEELVGACGRLSDRTAAQLEARIDRALDHGGDRRCASGRRERRGGSDPPPRVLERFAEGVPGETGDVAPMATRPGRRRGRVDQWTAPS